MADLVLTVLGDDRPGLVDALATAVSDNGGNWDRAQMTRLAGKFAGIVLVSVPEPHLEALRQALSALTTEGVLDVDVVPAGDSDATEPATATLTISGADRTGVLREMAHVLATRGVSIETLDTTTNAAAMAGGTVFEATAALVVPVHADLDALRSDVEAAVPGFLVEIEPRR